MELVRLNLGCGDHTLDGWTNIDRKTGGEVYPLAEYADDSVDEIRASHILEHFSHRQTLAVLAEWRRVLKPNGLLRVAVPDLDKIVSQCRAGTTWPIQQYLMGAHMDADDVHGAVFDLPALVNAMRDLGFAGFRRWKSETNDCASLDVSLNIAARKVNPASWKPQGMRACLSHPRYAPTVCMFQSISALSAIGVELARGGGVFWNQALQTMLEQFVADGVKYALTLDFDGIFVAEDIVQLYDYMERHPEVSAVCPVQVGRDRNTVLMTFADDAGKILPTIPLESLQAEAIPIRSGHFACAIIRVEDMKRLPKPWLCHKPDAQGGWSAEGRTDDDSHFWNLFREHGLKAVMHNRVSIGHVQEMVTWPTPTLTPVHQYAAEYNASGKPEGVLC